MASGHRPTGGLERGLRFQTKGDSHDYDSHGGCWLVARFCGGGDLGLVWRPRRLAARPKASELLPEDTLGLVSVTDTQELARRFMNTSLGLMSQDPQMKPVVEQLYGSMSDLVASAQEVIGLSLDQIVNLPHGEVTLACVAINDAQPAFVLLFDAGDQVANVRVLLQRAVDEASSKGAEKQEIGIKDTKITTLSGPGTDFLAFFDKEGTIVAGTNLDAVKRILSIWNGEKGKVLSDNANYGTIMNRCQGTNDTPADHLVHRSDQHYPQHRPAERKRACGRGLFAATGARRAVGHRREHIVRLGPVFRGEPHSRALGKPPLGHHR